MSDSKSHSDKILVSELKNHNEQAFRELYNLYYQDIYGYSISLLKSKEIAEENVQDVFMKIWQHRENLIPEQSFKSYLFTIARNQAFNILNKASNDEYLKEAIFYESQKSYNQSDYSIRTADCKKMKKEALSQLSPKRKLIFKMSRKQGKTYEEISQELGISVQTVKNQMSKSLETLRIYLKVHDEYIKIFFLFLKKITFRSDFFFTLVFFKIYSFSDS